MKKTTPVKKTFNQAQIESLAKALGNTETGLTNSEIDMLLPTAQMSAQSPDTKWRRIANAFIASQNKRRERNAIMEFMRNALNPSRFLNNPERFEHMRRDLNRALIMCGLSLTEQGKLVPVSNAKSISEARRRANDLRSDMLSRSVHPDVLSFCREELVADNYFHGVQEAVKSVSEKLRKLSGLTDDGAVLVDKTLCGKPPIIAINTLKTDSEYSEQKGFANLVKGTIGMFRNPTAHSPRKLWKMEKEDAADLLSLVSLIHRRLDSSHMPPRT